MDIVMKRIGVSYVYWYNMKYKRTGHLFQDRYKSEPIEDDRYFLTVLKYIHHNPVKAGIVARREDYEWSSYGEYFKGQKIIDAEMVLGLFSNQKLWLENYLREEADVNGKPVLEWKETGRIFDEEAKELIERCIEPMSLHELRNVEKEKRDELLGALKRLERLSIRQIARITGFTVNIVAKA